MFKSNKIFLFFNVVIIVVIVTIIAVNAWTSPTANPPGGGSAISAGSNAPANSIYIKSDGNVGIGTTAPGWKLDVVGGSMRADGYVAGGQLCMGYAAPDCRSSWASAGVQGGGTTNYVPKWTGGTSLGNSTIFDDGTTVTVSGNIRASGNIGASGGTPIYQCPSGDPDYQRNMCVNQLSTVSTCLMEPGNYQASCALVGRMVAP